MRFLSVHLCPILLWPAAGKMHSHFQYYILLSRESNVMLDSSSNKQGAEIISDLPGMAWWAIALAALAGACWYSMIISSLQIDVNQWIIE